MSFTAKLEKALNDHTSKVEKTIQAAKDLPEIGHLYTGIEAGRVRVDIPFTPTAYKEYRKALGSKWKQRSGMKQSTQNDVGDNYWYFIHENGVHLTLCLDAASEHATCKRVQIGMKEVPVFETICS